jgi:hypothetical protein
VASYAGCRVRLPCARTGTEDADVVRHQRRPDDSAGSRAIDLRCIGTAIQDVTLKKDSALGRVLPD